MRCFFWIAYATERPCRDDVLAGVCDAFTLPNRCYESSTKTTSRDSIFSDQFSRGFDFSGADCDYIIIDTLYMCCTLYSFLYAQRNSSRFYESRVDCRYCWRLRPHAVVIGACWLVFFCCRSCYARAAFCDGLPACPTASLPARLPARCRDGTAAESLALHGSELAANSIFERTNERASERRL